MGISLPPCARTRPGFWFQPLTVQCISSPHGAWQRQRGVSLRQLPPDSVLCYPLPTINSTPASKVYFFSAWVSIVLLRSSWQGKGYVLWLMGIFFCCNHLERESPPPPLQPLLLLLIYTLVLPTIRFSLLYKHRFYCENAPQPTYNR